MQAICVYARGFASAVYNGRCQHDSLERARKRGQEAVAKRKKRGPKKAKEEGSKIK